MKTLRFSLALIAASFAFAYLARAEDAKPVGTPAGSCKKAAAAAEKACTHGCCTDAAKTAKNCEKCGGKNEIKTEKPSYFFSHFPPTPRYQPRSPLNAVF
jgi:hypothetical protein